MVYFLFCKPRSGSHFYPVLGPVFTGKFFFDFIAKSPPASDLLRKAAGVEKGSGNPLFDKIAVISRDQVKEIAETKIKDLNAADIEGAIKIIEGTARSMGIQVR